MNEIWIHIAQIFNPNDVINLGMYITQIFNPNGIIIPIPWKIIQTLCKDLNHSDIKSNLY